MQNKFTHTLAYKSITSTYPLKGALITVPAKDIVDRIEEIKANRTEDMNYDYPIYSKFKSYFSFPGLLYPTEAEKTCRPEDSTICLKVAELIPGKTIKIRCKLEMFIFPEDVKEDEQYIELNADSVYVCQPILCKLDWHYSETVPDNVTSIGFYREDKKLWQVYDICDDLTDKINMPVMENFVTGWGIKNYSAVSPKEDMFIDGVIPFKTKSETVELESSMNNDEENQMMTYDDNTLSQESLDEEIFASHPLSSFTARLFESVLTSLNEHGIHNIDLRNQIYDNFKNITLMSDVYVGFDE